MQFLYHLRPTRLQMVADKPTPEEAGAIERHFNYLVELKDRGALILAGRTLNNDDATFGIVIFRADSEEDARRVMESDPAVAATVMQARLFPYKVALISEHNAEVGIPGRASK